MKNINKIPCVECGQPTTPPKGNWNAKRVALCNKKKCRRQRKTALQKKRRKRMLMTFLAEKTVPVMVEVSKLARRKSK